MGAGIMHDKENGVFYTQLNGDKAYMKYEKVDDSILDYKSTYVPEDHRGEGIASEIVTEALEFARANGYRIKPTCGYVDAFIKRNEEYRDLVA